MKYRTKPVEIEAFRYGYEAIPEWFFTLGGFVKKYDVYNGSVLRIKNVPENLFEAHIGNWVLNEKGDLTTYLHSEFMYKYESEDMYDSKVADVDKIDFQKALAIVAHEMASDKTCGSLFFGWKSNLAFQIMDNLKNDHYLLGNSVDEAIKTCNEIAEAWLNKIISESIDADVNVKYRPDKVQYSTHDNNAFIAAVEALQAEMSERNTNICDRVVEFLASLKMPAIQADNITIPINDVDPVKTIPDECRKEFGTDLNGCGIRAHYNSCARCVRML